MGSGGIGDTIFYTPAIRSIRENFPNAKIHLFFLGRGNIVFKKSRFIDKLIEAPKREHWNKYKIAEKLSSYNFDLAIIFDRHPSFRYLAKESKVKSIWCVTDIDEEPMSESFNKMYNENLGNYIHIARDRESDHLVKIPLDLIHEAGLIVNSNEIVMTISQEDEDFIDKLLEKNNVSESDLLIVFHPGATEINISIFRKFTKRLKFFLEGRVFHTLETRIWPLKYYAELGNLLNKKYRAKIIITGDKYETSLAKKISKLLNFNPIILSGKTTVWQLAALLKKVDLFVGGDTGPLHIAIAMKTPVIGIYGPTFISRTGPWGPESQFTVVKSTASCSPCKNTERDKTCTRAICMEQISVKEVFSAVESQLRKSSKI